MNIILSKHKVVILDFDGTILDSEGLWQQAYKSWCYMEGLNPMKKELVDYGKWIRLLYKIHDLKMSLPDFQKAIQKMALDLYKKKVPRPGFKSFYESLVKRDAIIIVVSREEESFVRAYMDSFLIGRVSEIRRDIDESRSTVAFYKELSDQYNCESSSLLLVDDSLLHCKAAKQAGATVMGINDGHSYKRMSEMINICDYYLKDFR